MVTEHNAVNELNDIVLQLGGPDVDPRDTSGSARTTDTRITNGTNGTSDDTTIKSNRSTMDAVNTQSPKSPPARASIDPRSDAAGEMGPAAVGGATPEGARLNECYRVTVWILVIASPEGIGYGSFGSKNDMVCEWWRLEIYLQNQIPHL